MTKLFAASAYVAAMSFAIVTESGPRAPQGAAHGSRETAAVLGKGDCDGPGCLGAAQRSEATELASLTRTGPNETTAARAVR